MSNISCTTLSTAISQIIHIQPLSHFLLICMMPSQRDLSFISLHSVDTEATLHMYPCSSKWASTVLNGLAGSGISMNGQGQVNNCMKSRIIYYVPCEGNDIQSLMKVNYKQVLGKLPPGCFSHPKVYCNGWINDRSELVRTFFIMESKTCLNPRYVSAGLALRMWYNK